MTFTARSESAEMDVGTQADGDIFVKVKMAEAVQLARLHGDVAVDWALGHAVTYARFADGDLVSILAAHPVGNRHAAGEDHSLQSGTGAREGFGGAR